MAYSPSKVPERVATDKLSWRAAWAARQIRTNLGSIERKAPGVPTSKADATHLLPAKGSQFTAAEEKTKLRVGIVGAGVAGLFTALIFDHLRAKYGLDVEYEILEANNRVGGRLYSYYFKQGDNHPKIGPHDYYDVGAMRFPEITIMDRTFDLFSKVLHLKQYPEEDPPVQAPKGGLIPYRLNGINQPSLYNGVQVVKDINTQPTARDFKIPDLPAEVMDKGAGDLIESTIQLYKDTYHKDGAKRFWELIQSHADLYSVRQWLTIKANYNYNTIEFLETLNYGNRWYDQSLSEMILESMDFDPKADWWCLEGGTQQIADRMKDELKHPETVELGKRVTAISYVDPKRDCSHVKVTVQGEPDSRTYDAVFNSTTLGAMQRMHLEGLNLHWGVKQAIRSLGYGASCKVGVRFKEMWWKSKCGITRGGQGKTDLPIRCCVYPSYNIHDPEEGPGVLLVSYTWSQEAERIGSLIKAQSPAEETELKEVLFHDLARLHAKNDDEEDYQRLYKIISDNYITHYAYNWYADPNMAGAFAYFGPGQFAHMYQHITKNDGKFIIIGEAASAHHAWVVGALESAVRGVYQFLHRHSHVNKAAAEAAGAYERDEIASPYGPVPVEFDRTDIIKPPADVPKDIEADLPPAIGDLARLQILFERIRLEQGGDQLDPSKITKEQIGNNIIQVGA